MGKLGDILQHPEEILPLWHMYQAAKAATKLPKDADLAFCYGMLNQVSRSFAVVIQQLPQPLRDAICIFYLVLRGLDTVEDDMAIPVGVKLPALKSFHADIYNLKFTMDCGTDHYQHLMKNFDAVVRVFLSLDETAQRVIADITKRMGDGMAEFIDKEVRSTNDYNLYCHYVAGLVGIGLSQLFASSGLEDKGLQDEDDLANQMGLFLQKTNIIRDYLEDINEEPAPRMFWPRAIWGAYAYALEDFKLPEQRPKALKCLNHMISDALQHLPKCLEYMQLIQHPNIFKFCAIPQVMAAGTLAKCYNNGRVFEGVVKMRRGQTARIFEEVGDLGGLYSWFLTFLEELQEKTKGQVAHDDPTLPAVRDMVQDNIEACEKALEEWRMENPAAVHSTAVRDYGLLLAMGTWAYYALELGNGQLPPFAAPYEAQLRSYQQTQQTLAVLLLLLVMWRLVAGKRG